MKFDKETILKLCKILLLVVVLYLLLRVVRFFLGGKGANQKHLDERLVKDGSTPTMTNSAAAVLANQLLTAMDRYGTDEDAITAVLMKIKGASDLAMVHNAFGVQPYDALMGVKPPTWLGRTFAENLTLLEWLSEELSADDFAPWRVLYDQVY